MVSIYLASRYERKAELKSYANDLIALGDCSINSSWLYNGLDDETVGKDASLHAARDLEDVDKSDLVICFTESDSTVYKRGGSHVELGYALAKGKIVLIVGPRVNIFHSLDCVYQFDTWYEAYTEMNRLLKVIEAEG